MQGINIYYSCYTAVLALLGLIIENKPLTVWSTALTVILAISIVYLNAQKYGNRAQELQTNYIALHKLLFDIEQAEAKNDISNLEIFTNKYCELLQTSENHINLNYLRQLKQKSELEGSEKAEYYFTMVVQIVNCKDQTAEGVCLSAALMVAWCLQLLCGHTLTRSADYYRRRTIKPLFEIG